MCTIGFGKKKKKKEGKSTQICVAKLAQSTFFKWHELRSKKQRTRYGKPPLLQTARTSLYTTDGMYLVAELHEVGAQVDGD